MARPRSGEPHWQVLTVKLPPEMQHALEAYCRQQHVSPSEAIRRGLTRLFVETAVHEASAFAEIRARAAAADAEVTRLQAKLATLAPTTRPGPPGPRGDGTDRAGRCHERPASV